MFLLLNPHEIKIGEQKKLKETLAQFIVQICIEIYIHRMDKLWAHNTIGKWNYDFYFRKKNI